MPDGVIASYHDEEDWLPREKDIKKYIHFDRYISVADLTQLANDSNQVAQNSFFPLLRFFEEWTKFRKNRVRKPAKRRPLRFACRKDAAIFARYRAVLSRLYDKELKRRGIDHVPVAYRRLKKEGGGHKSNVEISREVFDFIRVQKNCIVTVLDVKSYFESLDHSRILSIWEMLVGAPLPPDHMAVFRAVTRYSIVDVGKLFSRLELKRTGVGLNRTERRKREIDKIRAQGHLQICSPDDFRKFVAGSDPRYPSLIQKNGFSFGIPQGTPISDLIANFYLIDFDCEINSWATALGGIYRRYSDDIIVVLPTSGNSDFEYAKIIFKKGLEILEVILRYKIKRSL